jgi:hypothetical protein
MVYRNPHCPGSSVAASEKDFKPFVSHPLGSFLGFW